MIGYIINETSLNETCIDYDECSLESCSTNANCTNNDGSFTCDCMEGFRGDGVTCNDINECEEIQLGTTDEGDGPCSYKCENIPGSFRCSCDIGMVGHGKKELMPDGTIKAGCTDLNECDLKQHDCHSEAKCSNTIGSFTCECNKDYIGNGVRCSIPDKCHNVVCQGNATCWLDNTVDEGYKCKCDQTFQTDPNDEEKCITSKKCPFDPCVDENSNCVEDENHSDKYRTR